MYEHIRDSGRYGARSKAVAAATVNKLIASRRVERDCTVCGGAYRPGTYSSHIRSRRHRAALKKR